jgi:hypothetical protein
VYYFMTLTIAYCLYPFQSLLSNAFLLNRSNQPQRYPQSQIPPETRIEDIEIERGAPFMDFRSPTRLIFPPPRVPKQPANDTSPSLCISFGSFDYVVVFVPNHFEFPF